MADRDIMQLPMGELTKGEIGKIKIFERDAIKAGHMPKQEGMSRHIYKRFCYGWYAKQKEKRIC